MNYFLDLEFLEGPQKKLFGYTKSTIDLISIGIKCEDGREYYAISKDFNLKEAWNRFDWKQDFGKPQGLGDTKVYWIRENVLKSIYLELEEKELYEGSNSEYKSCFDNDLIKEIILYGWNRDSSTEKFQKLKKLIKKYGKTNKQIAEEVKHFCYNMKGDINNVGCTAIHDSEPKFYSYYADYDWVCFCWLFGKMIDLPKWFPMYCIDLKQELERLNETLGYNNDGKGNSYKIQEHKDYPEQTNEHNALSDAKWNFELYKFLNKL